MIKGFLLFIFFLNLKAWGVALPHVEGTKTLSHEKLNEALRGVRSWAEKSCPGLDVPSYNLEWDFRPAEEGRALFTYHNFPQLIRVNLAYVDNLRTRGLDSILALNFIHEITHDLMNRSMRGGKVDLKLRQEWIQEGIATLAEREVGFLAPTNLVTHSLGKSQNSLLNLSGNDYSLPYLFFDWFTAHENGKSLCVLIKNPPRNLESIQGSSPELQGKSLFVNFVMGMAIKGQNQSKLTASSGPIKRKDLAPYSFQYFNFPKEGNCIEKQRNLHIDLYELIYELDVLIAINHVTNELCPIQDGSMRRLLVINSLPFFQEFLP